MSGRACLGFDRRFMIQRRGFKQPSQTQEKPQRSFLENKEVPIVAVAAEVVAIMVQINVNIGT